MSITDYWQKIAAPVRGLFAAPSRQELQRGIEEISDQNSALKAELDQLRQLNVEATDANEQKLTALHQHVEQALDKNINRIVELDQRVEQVSEQGGQQLAELDRKIDRFSNENTRKLSDLERNVELARSESETAQKNVAGLRGYLSEVKSGQNKTDQQTRDMLLKVKLEKNRQLDLLQQVQDRGQIYEHRSGRMLWVAGVALIISIAAGSALILGHRNYDRAFASLDREIGNIRLSLSEYSAAEFDRPRSDEIKNPATMIAHQPGAVRDRYAEPVMNQKTRGLLPDPEAIGSSSSGKQGKIYGRRENAQKFFKENARQLGVVSLSSGLQYKVISQGNGRTPGLSDKVKVNYRAYSLDGTEFDSSYQDSEETVYTLDEVIPGWKEALLRMEEGAQWELYIPANLTHKGSTRKRGMFGYEPLVYIMELKAIIDADTADGNKGS